MAILPHGRRLDSDPLKQAETDRFRQELATKKGGLWCSTLGDGFFAANTSATSTNSSLVLYPMPPREKDVRAVEARVRVTSLAAGEYLHAALYQVYENTKLTQLPGSAAKFSVAGTGIVTYAYNRPFDIPADKLLFCGITAASSTSAVSSGNGSRVHTNRRVASWGANVPPDQLNLATMASAGFVGAPLVAWFSAQGAALLPAS